MKLRSDLEGRHLTKFTPSLAKHSPLWYVVVTASPALLLLTVIGPFGTYSNFNVIERLFYWAAMLASCGPVFELVVPKFLYSPRFTGEYARARRFTLGVMASVVCSFWLVYSIEYISRGPISVDRLPHLLLGLVVIGGTISYFRFMFRSTATLNTNDKTDINYDHIPFFAANPDLLGLPIRWITMQDHYALVVLEGAEKSIHASMAELERQLNNYPGIRIHRSHWVAYRSMHDLKKAGRSFQVDIGDGKSLPVGVTYLKKVERIFSELVH